MATSATEWMNMASGKSWTAIAKQGIGGWLLALLGSIITGTESVFQVLITPLNALADVAGDIVRSFGGAPAELVAAGARISSNALEKWGLLAILAGAVLAMATYYIVTQYLQLEATPDWIPLWGVPDLPTDWLGADEDEK